jgi:hypothetical protein
MTQEKDPLSCFGNLEKVFPMGEDGFRLSPPECMQCPMATPCLQAAMREKDGLKLKEKRIDQAYELGLITTFERWSQKKLLQKEIKKKAKQGKS